MFSGKSTELIRQIRREQIAENEVQLFKYAQDARYASVEEIATFDGSMVTAVPVHNTRELIDLVKFETQFVVIDEAQFFDDILIDYVGHLVDQRKRVMVACLNLNFRGEPFPFGHGSQRTVADLLIRADKMIHLTAVCMHRNIQGRRCGREATRTQRIVNGKPAHYSEPIKLIGAQEAYVVRCVEHHIVPGKICSVSLQAVGNK